MFAETRLRNAIAILLVIGVHLVIPKISEVTANFTSLNFSGSKAVASNHGAKMKTKSQDLDEKNDQDEEFQPPYTGGPDSERGSGTR